MLEAMRRDLREFVRTVDDPRKSDVSYGINRLVNRQLSVVSDEQVAETARDLPRLADLHAELYDPKIDLAALAKLPRGTLGHRYAHFMLKNGIEPLDGQLALRDGTMNLIQYAAIRAYKLHDVLHAVLGCDASVLGEVRVVSFTLGQGGGFSASLALLVLFLHVLVKRPRLLPRATQLSRVWRQLGRGYGYHLTFRFEDHWESHVEDVLMALKQHPDRW